MCSGGQAQKDEVAAKSVGEEEDVVLKGALLFSIPHLGQLRRSSDEVVEEDRHYR